MEIVLPLLFRVYLAIAVAGSILMPWLLYRATSSVVKSAGGTYERLKLIGVSVIIGVSVSFMWPAEIGAMSAIGIGAYLARRISARLTVED